MYLKSVTVENVGPIKQIRLEMPFTDGRPLPLLLVGPNGSGKSTLLSLVVNALVGFKQQAYEQTEVEQNKVYRVRSGMFIRHGAQWSHTKLDFEAGLGMEEWVLNRPRKEFESQIRPLPDDARWRSIAEEESSSFALTPPPSHTFGGRAFSKPIQKLFAENVVLFFPSDRFELPDWLNERSLAQELRFPEVVRFEGHTARRIFSRALLRPTLEWLKAVTLDARLSDLQPLPSHNLPVPCYIETLTANGRILGFVGKVLARILGADGDRVRFHFSHRNMAMVGVVFTRAGREEYLPNLLSLSAGQAALFCLFSNIIRDFDLTASPLDDISDVRGVVVIDEADLHLHVDLQYRVLPELMRLFPKVQFILTAHSPLFVMGMEQSFGPDGFRVLDVATGQFIPTEDFSEFGHALAAFTRTRAFDQRVLEEVLRAAKPVVLVEGVLDVPHLQTAWAKLNPGPEMPWEVLPCGGVGAKENRGGADMLKKLLWACSLHIERPALGLFDHDAEGVERFGGLEADGFAVQSDPTHKRHASKPVQALLLPVPPSRTAFVGSKPRSCFLSLEHYYSDALLSRFDLMDEPVASDSAVFGIVSDTKKKRRFAEALPDLNSTEFENFRLLFERLTHLLGGSPAALPPTELDHGDSTAAPPTMLALTFDPTMFTPAVSLTPEDAAGDTNANDRGQSDAPRPSGDETQKTAT